MKYSRSLLAGLVRRPLRPPPKPLPPPPWQGRSEALHIALSERLGDGWSGDSGVRAAQDRIMTQKIPDNSSPISRAFPHSSDRASPISLIIQILKSDRLKGTALIWTPTLLLGFMLYNFKKSLPLERELSNRVAWDWESAPGEVTYWRYDNLVGDWIRNAGGEHGAQLVSQDAAGSESSESLSYYEVKDSPSEDAWSAIRKAHLSNKDDEQAVEGQAGNTKPWIDKKKLILALPPHNRSDVDWFSAGGFISGIATL